VLAALPGAVIATGRPRRVCTTDTCNSLTLGGLVNALAIIDITPTYEQKRRALAAHSGTQPIEEHFGPMADDLSRLRGARIGVPRAEAFTPVPVLGRLPGMPRL
jgi:N-acetylglucosamine malate deacetylase 1